MEGNTLGVVTGLAFITKRITAFFIPILWFCISMTDRDTRKLSRLIPAGTMIVIATSSVSAPLLYHLAANFPKEFDFFLSSTITPVHAIIQGHDYAWYFYFNHARIIFGEIIYIPMIWLLYKVYRALAAKISGKSAVISKSTLMASILIFVPMILLSCMQTRRNAYLLFSATGFFVLSGLFYHYIKIHYRGIRLPGLVLGLILVLSWALPIRYGIERVKPFKKYEAEKRIVAEIKQLPLEGKHIVLFNEPYPIRAMFYHENLSAYSWIPEQAILTSIDTAKYTIYIRSEDSAYRWK